MSLSRMYTPVLHFDDINGRPLVGGKLYTYEANSSTPAPTYRDKSGTLLNENPISLDERGECEVWLVDGLRYKMVLVDPIGTQVWEADDVSSSGSGSSSLQRINIFSSDHSVDVEEKYVSQTDSFNVDLSVKYDNLIDKPISALFSTNSDTKTYQGESPPLIVLSYIILLFNSPSWTEGTKISLIESGTEDYFGLIVPEGVVVLDGCYEFIWDDSVQLRNEIVNLEGTPFDLSYYHSQLVPFHLVNRYTSQNGITITPDRTDWPIGLKFRVKNLSVVYLGEL